MRPPLPRLLLAGLLGLALGALPACFVFEELDAGMETMERVAPSKKPEPEPARRAAAPSRGEGGEPAPRRSIWEESGRSINPHERNAEIARCELGGSVQFMTRSDCLARGGRPG